MSKTSGAFYPKTTDNLIKTPNSNLMTGQDKLTSRMNSKREIDNRSNSIRTPNISKLNQTSSMNKTTRDGFGKMTYAQKLDQFMETNKLKYINDPLPRQKMDSNLSQPEKIPDKA